MAAIPRFTAAEDARSRLIWRQLLTSDLAQVAAIEARAYPYPWTLGNFRDSLASGYDCLGAFQGDDLVGYAIVMFAVDEAHLLNVTIDPQQQGQGLGRQTVAQVVTLARSRDSVMLYLEVRPSNSVARALYASMGFRQIAIRPGYYPAPIGREDALFLGLKL